MRQIPVTSALLFGLTLLACEKTTRPVAETQTPTPSASSAATTETPPSPASSKSGPTPDDPSISNVAPVPLPPPSETRPLATGNNAFAFDFWKKIGSKPGNLAFSPMSVSIAFAMTWPGAKGETATQLKKVLHFDGDADKNAAGWGNLSRVLTTPPRWVRLRIANRLYGEKTYTFEKPFVDKTRDVFKAPMDLVDFKNDPDKQRTQINGWVEEKTEQRIKDLLPQGALDKDTRLVLVNAIYFLADWAKPFEKHLTREEPFDAAGKKKRAPMMHAKAEVAFAQTEGVKILGLDYKGGDTAMYFVLPDKVDGLPALEKSISPAKLEAWAKATKPKDVEISLPRFEIAPPSLQLAQELAELGMPDAFDRDKADFTGIANPPSKADRLFIAKVFHKAFVKVDEKGTEAAAATAVVMAKGGGAPAPPDAVFKADHPFLFFLVDKSTGLVLFMGRVEDPTTK